jgi:hypothetical protein
MTHARTIFSTGLSLLALASSAGALANPAKNGRILNTATYNGRILNSAQANTGMFGTQGAHVSLEGSELVAGGRRAEQIVGLSIDAQTSDQQTIKLAITGAYRPAAGDDVWEYDVGYNTVQSWTECDEEYGVCWTAYNNVWTNICGEGRAIALQGSWDYGVGINAGGRKFTNEGITFACPQGAIAKCVRMGYKPWRGWELTTVNGWYLVYDEDYGDYWQYGPHEEWHYTDMEAKHLACTRMIRADYCGDGRSWTSDGTDIEVVDTLNPQKQLDSRPSWGVLEGVWGPEGARCVTQPRWRALATSQIYCKQRDPNNPAIINSVYALNLEASSSNCAAQAEEIYNKKTSTDISAAPTSAMWGGW